jgi:hypothetical protein
VEEDIMEVFWHRRHCEARRWMWLMLGAALWRYIDDFLNPRSE